MPRDKTIKKTRLTYDTDIGTIRYGIKITMKNMAKAPVEKVHNTHCQMSNFSRKGNYKEKKREARKKNTVIEINTVTDRLVSRLNKA